MKTLQLSMSYQLTNTILQFHMCGNCEFLGSHRVKSELCLYIYIYILHMGITYYILLNII
jgi:hypothetical protein